MVPHRPAAGVTAPANGTAPASGGTGRGGTAPASGGTAP
ncbi:MAG: hypothetical protein QOI56_814, partial [Actinomycetota bacterium]|nr:hypothetical protein [Actinomycetota bacterium]